VPKADSAPVWPEAHYHGKHVARWAVIGEMSDEIEMEKITKVA
jgi:hypothetical protein